MTTNRITGFLITGLLFSVLGCSVESQLIGTWTNSGVFADGDDACGSYSNTIAFNETNGFSATYDADVCSDWSLSQEQAGQWTAYEMDDINYLHLVITYTRYEELDDDGDGEFEVSVSTREDTMPFLTGSNDLGDYLILGEGMLNGLIYYKF